MLAKLVVVAALMAIVRGDAVASPRCNEAIERDVAIIGGGASGSYAAVQIRETYKKSVVMIEVTDHMGGHVASYLDPNTSTLVNYGAGSINDYGNARKFFAQMNVSTQPRQQHTAVATTVYVDPFTGKEIQNYTAPTWPNTMAAIAKLAAIAKQYDDILVPGYWNFPAGKDIPADLLLPWGQYVAKYHLEDLFWILKTVCGPIGRVDQLTLFVLMNFNTITTTSFAAHSTFDPLPFDMGLIFNKVKDYLGQDALMSTKVIYTTRTDKGVNLVAKRANGRTTCIKAKQLLITAQPSLSNLANFDLDWQEIAMFSTWSTASNFVFLVRTNFIPGDRQVTFMSPTSTDLPFNFAMEATNNPNIYRVLFNSQFKVYSLDAARAAVTKYIQNLINGGIFKGTTSTPSFKFEAETDFTSIQYNPSVAMLKNDFMKNLYALEGKRSTWYTGGLWCSDLLAGVWAFTDTLLPKMFNQTQ